MIKQKFNLQLTDNNDISKFDWEIKKVGVVVGGHVLRVAHLNEDLDRELVVAVDVQSEFVGEAGVHQVSQINCHSVGLKANFR